MKKLGQGREKKFAEFNLHYKSYKMHTYVLIWYVNPNIYPIRWKLMGRIIIFLAIFWVYTKLNAQNTLVKSKSLVLSKKIVHNITILYNDMKFNFSRQNIRVEKTLP